MMSTTAAQAQPGTPDCANECAIGRRAFIMHSAVLAAVAALAACGASGDATAPSISSTNNTIDVNNFPALASVGGIAVISLGNAPLAIVRTGQSTFLALSRICPHQGGTIGQSGNGFQCPVHGAQFTATGQWEGGQRTSNMFAYTTSYDAVTGTLTIT
ncbi:MAG TPA: Rieske (2Fe-2S) protein [Gemmatimonadaceae bacterium]